MKSRMPYLLLAALCVSAGGLSSFGAPVADYLTNAELEKISFASVADPPFVENALIFPELKSAIFLPATEVEEGDPIPAWLLLKSLTHEMSRGVPVIFDLGETGEKPKVQGSARIQLTRVKNGSGAVEDKVIADLKGKMGNNTPRVLLEPGGFFVNSGNLQNLSATPNVALPAGDYVLRFWAEGQRSEAGFKIVGRHSPLPAAAATQGDRARHELEILNWEGGFNGRPTARAGGPIHWALHDGYLAPTAEEDFRASLALGVGRGPEERHYSRIEELRDNDETLTVSAAYNPATPNKIQITLTPKYLAVAASQPATAPATPPASMPATAPATGPAGAGQGRRRRPAVPAAPADPKEVQLPGYLTVYLLVENLGSPIGFKVTSQRQGGSSGGTNRFNAPVILDAQLPPQWNNNLGFEGKARLSIVIASDPLRPGIEQPGEADPQNLQNIYGQGVAARGRNFPKHWSGIVKTAPIPLTIAHPEAEKE